MWWVLCIAMGVGVSQAQSIQEIEPPNVASGAQRIRGPHIVIKPTQPNGLVLVSIGGTNSKPKELLDFNKAAALLGFFVLAVDYPNQVITTTCRPQPERDCFDQFRREIVTGQSVSPWVEVNPANALETRIESLAQHIGAPLDWSRVVLLGHSQGAGHAAYLAKRHKVHAALMLAGPQDGFKGGELAPWLSETSLTPAQRLLFLFHKDDPFDVQIQTAVARKLLGDETAATRTVAHVNDSIKSAAQILVLQNPVKDPHNGMLHIDHEPLWRSILRRIMRLELIPQGGQNG